MDEIFARQKISCVCEETQSVCEKVMGEMGMDTTEVQLTTDGVRYYSYVHDGGTDEEGEVMSDICWCPDSRHLYLVRGR